LARFLGGRTLGVQLRPVGAPCDAITANPRSWRRFIATDEHGCCARVSKDGSRIKIYTPQLRRCLPAPVRFRYDIVDVRLSSRAVAVLHRQENRPLFTISVIERDSGALRSNVTVQSRWYELPRIRFIANETHIVFCFTSGDWFSIFDLDGREVCRVPLPPCHDRGGPAPRFWNFNVTGRGELLLHEAGGTIAVFGTNGVLLRRFELEHPHEMYLSACGAVARVQPDHVAYTVFTIMN
jgi:hypothetical protein